jgi:hypothetical protein
MQFCSSLSTREVQRLHTLAILTRAHLWWRVPARRAGGRTALRVVSPVLCSPAEQKNDEEKDDKNDKDADVTHAAALALLMSGVAA